MSRIVTFGLAEDLIAGIAGYIEKNYLEQGKDLGKLAVVFEGRRPSLFLRRALAKKLRRSFFPPVFYSIDEFLREVVTRATGRVPLSDIDASYVLYEIARKVAPEVVRGRENFAQFLPWSAEISAFIDHVDREDIEGSLLRNVQANAEIGYDIPENINTLLRNISVIREAYHAELEQRGQYSKGLLYLLAARHIDKAAFGEFDEILFCNFFYMHKTEEDVLKSFYDRGLATLVFQGDQKDWSVLRRAAERFGEEIRPQRYLEPRYELHLHAGFDTHSQIALVREVAKKVEHHDDSVLVVPESESLIPLLSELASVVEDVNVSLGYPLKRSSLYSLLEYVFKAQTTKKGDRYYARDYLRAVNHPLVKNLRLPFDPNVTRVMAHKIEELLLGVHPSPVGGSLFVRTDEIGESAELYDAAAEMLYKMDASMTRKEELKALVTSLHELLFTRWETIASFADFAAALKGFLETLVRNSFLTSYPLNAKAVEMLLRIADELEKASFSGENFSKEDIFKIVLDRIGSEMVSFNGSPLHGFQVLGFMESRALSFENVIVMDMNEGVIPRLRVNEPLIPREVMLSLGLSRPEKEEEIQRYQFMRLVAAAKNVHLVYSDDPRQEKSRFIEELIWQRQKASKTLSVVPSVKARFDMTSAPSRLPRSKSPEILSHLRGLKYSSTSINTYLDCPLRFYFQYVLGLREKEDLLEEPDGAEIGIFIHEVLQTVYEPLKGKALVIDDAFEKRFRETLDRSFEKHFASKMKSDAFLLKDVIDFRMQRFLRSERERAGTVTEIVALEEEIIRTIDFGGVPYVFKARVDRIDRLVDGSLLVIDYKTGSSRAVPAKLKSLQYLEMTRESIKDKVASFQLPLYVHLMAERAKKTLIDAAIYDLRAAELANYFYEGDAESRDQKSGLCMKALEHIIGEITDPAVPFVADDADRDRCAVCPFYYVCR